MSNSKSPFAVLGNTLNLLLPLSFNFDIQSTVSVSAPAPSGIAAGLASYSISTSAASAKGEALISGAFGEYDTFFSGSYTNKDLNVFEALKTEVETSDTITAQIGTNARADATGSAMANIFLSFSLITIPNSFVIQYPNLDVSNLAVQFDNGVTIPITVAAAPEPPAFILMGLGVVLLTFLRGYRVPAVERRNDVA